jgi:hypothetical protein
MSSKTSVQNPRALPRVADQRPSEHVAKCLLGIGSLIMMGWGILGRDPVMIGSGAIMAGLLVLSRLIVDLRCGVTSSNWGTWRRDENRGLFRCNICFWAFVTALWFMLGILIIGGFIQEPSGWVSQLGNGRASPAVSSSGEMA